MSLRKERGVSLKQSLFEEFAATDSFDVFWEHYPRRVAKADAQKAWGQLKMSPDLLVAIVAALEWQKQTPVWREQFGKFIPHPARWLRGRRWEDERPVERAVSAGGILLECPHDPPCESRWRCGQRQLMQRAS